MKPELIRMDRKYTSNGREVVIHTVNGKDAEYPVIGEIYRGESAGWSVEQWTADGRMYSDEEENCADLIPKLKKIEQWLNHYIRNGMHFTRGYPTQQMADEWADNDRIGPTQRVEMEVPG